MPRSWEGYEGEAGRRLAEEYEGFDAEAVHGWLADLIPAAPGAALDIGAGSGRDAAWLAGRGLEVMAAEPSAIMRGEGARRHPDPRVAWVDAALPRLDAVQRMGVGFDLILLSAVWQHVAPVDRPRAVRKLAGLLKPGGYLAMTLRHGPPAPGRAMHPVSIEEVAQLGRDHGLVVVREGTAPDRRGREGVSWSHVALRLPDDGTGALPLLRHVILNDAKSSTYKLGLLRAVARAADGARGLVRPVGDDAVAVPLGLVALNWLRLYKPLLEAGLPQAPRNAGPEGLGFAKEGWRGIAHLAAAELRPGARFAGDTAEALHAALRNGASTVARMPATFMTWPGSAEPVMPAERGRPGRAPETLLLDGAYLWRFGELRVPLHLWRALGRLNAWIEPALVAEWARLMEGYAAGQGRALDPGVVARATRWSEPARYVGFARRAAADLLARGGGLHCVWTGRRLSEGRLDIDHALPWAAWPCEDLWNLLPSDPRVNRHAKRDRLPSAEAIEGGRQRMLDWWERGYVRRDEATAERLVAEAAASLPLGEAALGGEGPPLEAVFAGLRLRRLAIRGDQGVEEWTPEA